jgi:predicted ATP-dependent endonuclease of OLD family
MEHSAAYIQLKESFENFEGIIKTETTDQGFSLKSIEDDVTKNISDWGTEFRLSVNPIGVDDLVKSLIGHDIYDNALGEAQPPSSYGQGFQRSLIYTLIRVAAKYVAETSEPNPKEFSPQLTWILFEEPEAFLHPTQIDALNGDLRVLAKTDVTQILLTTHSSHFATHSVDDLPAICRLHKIGCESKAYQIAESQLQTILISNQTDIPAWQAANIPVHADDLNVDMESIKYALWLDAKRASAMFSERVLLVEGPTETALLSYLFDKGELDCCRGVYVIDTIGKFNIHRFMMLFGHFGIKHYVLHDGDNGKYTATVDKTIQASSNAFTGGIDTFTKDIEDFLGIGPAGSPHRKPQHIMHNVVTGKVDAAKVQALAQKIGILLSK